MITQLLQQLRVGDQNAKDQLFKLVYPELRRIASRRMRSEKKGHTFQTADLVHETYLRVFAQQKIEIKDRLHLYALCARAMRRILIDIARKRANGSRREFIDQECDGSVPNDPDELIALHEALSRLEQIDARQSQITEMRFFGGMNEDEIAEVLGVSARTVKRDWAMARAWLLGELSS